MLLRAPRDIGVRSPLTIASLSIAMPRSQCRHVDEQYRQHLQWCQSKTTGETAQSSTAKRCHYLNSLTAKACPSRLVLARLGPLLGRHGGYILRGLMIQPILPTIRTRAREAVKPQDILLGDGAQKEFESEEEHSTFNPHLHCNMWSQASVQGRG
jgi:hypothetical protein